MIAMMGPKSAAVGEVLVVGERVNGFYVTVLDAEFVVDDFEHWGNRVGGTRRCRQDRVAVFNSGVVDTVHNVLDVTLTGRSEDDFANTLGLQVLAQALFIAPATGVVNNNGVLDAVFGVVHCRWVGRVNDLDENPVGQDGVVFLVDSDRAVELTVYRVTAQKRGTLDDVVFTVLADHNCAKAQDRKSVV